ncbi:MAG: alternative ribosome rescue aminoacyl-tRNA hydrolase ArfB, partial [bacterium]
GNSLPSRLFPAISPEHLTMRQEETIRITKNLSIPLEEIHFHFSRSSGPGGQRVNRKETRVELLFDVLHSPTLKEEEKRRISEALFSHIDREGVLHLISQKTRSQWKNREDVLQRFQFLLRSALRMRKKRIATVPPPYAKEARLQEKKQKSKKKALRKKPGFTENSSFPDW